MLQPFITPPVLSRFISARLFSLPQVGNEVKRTPLCGCYWDPSTRNRWIKESPKRGIFGSFSETVRPRKTCIYANELILILRRLMSYIYGAPILDVSSGPAARLLRSWVRIPPGAWVFVCCECRVLSGRGLCDELITLPEESYRLWCVVVYDLETWRIGAPYIYDISNLRVNDLTLILLTRRKWWANNASK